ncbi:MAG: methyltransferase domain-containing protein [Rhizobiales bacterium]|nr:methyltransferase domain-containing protein [Hyphomicrobiales bacterium]
MAPDRTMPLPRTLETEWLDVLPADDPRAMVSRRDLRLVNRLMFNVALAARRLKAIYPAGCKPRRILDLGAGDGTWMLALARRLARHWPGVEVTLLDRQSLVAGATRESFAALGWKAETATAGVFDYLKTSPAPSDIVIANLFLHHFEEADLSRLLALIAGTTGCFIAVEPRRARFALTMSRFLWAVGCNRVTRHDAVASVRAGFTGDELSASWPQGGRWHLREEPAWPFSHCFVARHVSDGL